MSKSGIEDILIGDNYRNKKKKKGKGLVIFFLLLLIVLIALCGYYYIIINQSSQKELFITHLSQHDISNFLNNNIYENIYTKLFKLDSEINTSMNFSTTLENEELKGFDLSKFTVELISKNDVENSNSFGELGVNYSDNEIFNIKTLLTENEVAVLSNEILDKYIGLHYDKIQDIYNTNINIQEFKNFKILENVEITEEEKQEYIKKYFYMIFDNFQEQNFSSKENIVIKNKTENVNVTAYTLTLNQQELNNTIINLLENLKNDEQLLSKFALKNMENTNENKENKPSVTITPIVPDETHEEQEQEPNGISSEGNTEEIIQEPNTENIVQEENENSNTTEAPEQPEKIEELNNESNIENNQAQNSIPVITINPVGSVTSIEQPENSEVSNNTIEVEKQEEFYSNLIKILLGKKLNLTIEDVQQKIDEYIEIAKKIEGNGIIFTIYSSTEKIEKINIVLPNLNTIDIEFYRNNENDNSIKLTYLYKKEDKNNGFSLELNKVENNANTKINLIYSFIENEQINKKITLNLKTDGTANSKELKNSIILTISTNQGETKCIVDNLIKFSEVSNLEELNIENCLFLDELSEEERTTTIEDLKNKIINIYTSKKENLNFIDTNTYSTIVDTLTSNVTREEAKNALITKISNMMRDAIDKNEEFTIQNLVDLKIDGYTVTSTVTEESAVIVVDVYTFNINKTFLLTDVE